MIEWLMSVGSNEPPYDSRQRACSSCAGSVRAADVLRRRAPCAVDETWQRLVVGRLARLFDRYLVQPVVSEVVEVGEFDDTAIK